MDKFSSILDFVNEAFGDMIIIGLFAGWFSLLCYHGSWNDWGLPMATGIPESPELDDSKERKMEMYAKADRKYKWLFRARL